MNPSTKFGVSIGVVSNKSENIDVSMLGGLCLELSSRFPKLEFKIVHSVIAIQPLNVHVGIIEDRLRLGQHSTSATSSSHKWATTTSESWVVYFDFELANPHLFELLCAAIRTTVKYVDSVDYHDRLERVIARTVARTVQRFKL